MHVLLTTDSVGGVWTYTEELSAGLVANGHQVTLVSLGTKLDRGQQAWVASMRSPLFHCVETEYRLEWMDDPAEDLLRSRELLCDLIARLQPDLLHTNQFAYGTLSDTLPVLLTGHSDVLSWWQAVHGESAPDTGRLRAYTALVRAGLLTATRLAAPTAWMARELREQYGVARTVEVIPNGRSPELFTAGAPKQLRALTVGRAWDPGKNTALLDNVNAPMPLLVAGEAASPAAPAFVADAPATVRGGITYLGKQHAPDLRELYARTAIYIATSCYEPFGLAPLEAALSGCALVLADLPTLREIWADAAFYFPPRDPTALASVLGMLARDPDGTRALAARAHARAREHYTARAMVRNHEAVYGAMLAAAVPAQALA